MFQAAVETPGNLQSQSSTDQTRVRTFNTLPVMPESNPLLPVMGKDDPSIESRVI